MPPRAAVGAAAPITVSPKAWRGTITPTPPFDLAQTIRVLEVSTSVREGFRTEPDGSLTGAVGVAEHVVVFTLTPKSDGDLTVTLTGALAWTDVTSARAIAAIDHFLALSEDLRPFYAMAAQDPAFAPVISAYHGYHPTRFPSPFEAACWAILTQHNHMSIAGKMKRDLMHTLGNSITLGDDSYVMFLTARQLASASPELLLATLKNEQRAMYLYGLAHAFRDGDPSVLTAAPYDDATASPCRLPVWAEMPPMFETPATPSITSTSPGSARLCASNSAILFTWSRAVS
jgi:DNA-3-methyladenine glycosylase II